MQLHQLRVDFVAEHDRLLLRVATSDGKEALLWLTRRCVKLLWPALLKLVESSARVQLQGTTAEARAALLGMEHEKAVQQADFSKPYDESARERLLGDEPILVARVQTRTDAEGRFVLTLLPIKGQGVNLALDATMLHSFCKLLQDVVAKAEWEFKLEFPASPLAAEAVPGARVLN